MSTTNTDTGPAREELNALMKICPASVRNGSCNEVVEFKRAIAGGYRALGNTRSTPASLRAAAAALRAFGA